MREERGQIDSDVLVSEPMTLFGSVGGDVRVVSGGKLYLHGIVIGALIVDEGGRVHIYGTVAGNVRVLSGAKIVHSGVIGGDVLNEGGRFYSDLAAVVNGKVKTTRQGTSEIARSSSGVDEME
jgi:cytoskeletal protein CcmA (bactofilin family)